MTALLDSPGLQRESLTEDEWAAKMRAESVVRDKSYRRYPIGQEVGHYMRALAVERKAPSTRDSYETVLRLLALYFRDYPDLSPFNERGGEEGLSAFLAHYWGDAADATMYQRFQVLAAFFDWAERTDRITRNPMRRMRTSRQNRRTRRRAHELAEIRRIVAAQDTVRDEAALLLMGRLGFRKMEVGKLRARDVDLAHDLVYIRRGKGGKPAEVPIVFRDVRDALSLWLSERPRHADEYLLAPRGHPRRCPNPATVHRWYVRCLERAGAAHFPMHELRHSAADRLWRRTGNVVLAHELLRHASLATTREYLHPSNADLRAGMRLSEEDEE